MNINIKKYITEKDLFINNYNAWPKRIKEYLEKNKEAIIYSNEFKYRFLDFLIKNKYSLIGFHLTRLLESEIRNIVKDGLKVGNKDFYKLKIKNLPINIKQKESLIKYINGLSNTQSNELIYCNFSSFRINKKRKDDSKRFLLDWGGETIYNYYDNKPNQDKEILRKRINNISSPKICILRKNFDSNDIDLIEKLLKKYPSCKDFDFNCSKCIDSEKIRLITIVDFYVNNYIFYK